MQALKPNAHKAFNETKATQVAAQLLRAAPGRRLSYLSLIKLMYLADRTALERWASPITNDKYYSLDYGPVLSNVLNLINLGPRFENGSWSVFISAPTNYMVELVDEPGISELSQAEVDLIDETFASYGKLSKWDLVELTHGLQEWKDPEGSAIPISIEDILEATGMKADEARETAADLKSIRQVHAIFAK